MPATLGFIDPRSSSVVPPSLGTGDMYASGPWYQALGRTVRADAIDPRSDLLMGAFTGAGTLSPNFRASTSSGGNSSYTYPYAIVDYVALPLKPIATILYAAESDPGVTTGQYPIPDVIGQIYNQSTFDGNADHDYAVLVRGPAGVITDIWEYYQLRLDDVAASPTFGKYLCNGVARFNLVTGQPRPDQWTSADGGGLSKFLGLIRYDEVAAGVIPHFLRACVDAGNVSNRYTYPARHAIAGFNPTNGLPMGARLRLRADWYTAHAGDFAGMAHVVVNCLYDHGLIVADIAISGTAPVMSLDGVADDRWIQAEVMSLYNIPISAFEVCEIHPGFTCEYPATVRVGATESITFRRWPTDDSNFGGNIYTSIGQATLSDATPAVALAIPTATLGPVTITLTPYPDWVRPADPVVQVISSMAQLTTTLRVSQLALAKTALDTGGAGTGKLKVYSGAAPGIANAASGVLLATLTAASLTAPVAGASTLTATAANAVATGTPGYYRLTDSTDVVVIEGPAGVGAGELNCVSTLVTGAPVSLTGGTITEGNA